MQDHKGLKLNFTKILQFDSSLVIIKKLQESGYQAVFAGGSVRDIINLRSDIENIDIDIATSALPEEVEKLFPHTVAVGKAFGVIRVIIKHQSLEVATFRKDGPYKDGRRPETVNFVGIKEDAQRRDFTVNALFYDPIQDVLYDFVDGLADLKNKTLRAVGDPFLRFQEDELRRLRLIRFVSQLGFEIEAETWKAMKQDIGGIKKVSPERITDEIYKLWKGQDLKKAFQLFWQSGMAEVLNPGLVKPYLNDFEHVSKGNIWLHYFFVMYGFQDSQKRLTQFKLSSEIQKNILKAQAYYQKVDQFLDLKFSQQRLDWNDPTKAWVVNTVLNQNPKWISLKEKLNEMGPLPQPLLNGHDLKDHFQGADLGRALEKLYLLQLEQGWSDRQQAFEYLNLRFKVNT